MVTDSSLFILTKMVAKSRSAVVNSHSAFASCNIMCVILMGSRPIFRNGKLT